MKLTSLIIFTFLFCLKLTGQGQKGLQESDSLFVLQQIYNYDFDTKVFDDIDEMYLEEIWYSDKNKAEILFRKAIELNSAPIYERMILASYFYHSNDQKLVYKVLKSCRTREDSSMVYNIMNTYRIKYSDFNIRKEQVEKYCEKCHYN